MTRASLSLLLAACGATTATTTPDGPPVVTTPDAPLVVVDAPPATPDARPGSPDAPPAPDARPVVIDARPQPPDAPAPDASFAAYTSSRGLAINAAGVVVGEVGDGFNLRRAALFSAGTPKTYTVTDLGSLGGATTTVEALSATGKATGVADVAGGHGHAFLWSGGQITDLGTLAGDTSSHGYGVADDGRVVGSSSGAAAERAMVYAAGTMTAVAPPSATTSSRLYAINASGQMVGFYVDPPYETAFYAKTGIASSVKLPSAVGLAINDSGLIVLGAVLAGASLYPYPGGPETPLPTVNGFVLGKDVNAGGDVVGWDRNGTTGFGSGYDRAFKLHAGVEGFLGVLGDPGVVDLNDQISAADQALYTLISAVGIGASGQIACRTQQGKSVLLTPK